MLISMSNDVIFLLLFSGENIIKEIKSPFKDFVLENVWGIGWGDRGYESSFGHFGCFLLINLLELNFLRLAF